MDDMKLFVPITKIDAAKRLVYGVVTAEKPDVTGEVCDYASTKPLYQKWSQKFASATDGKSLGNLRAMHGHIAAGKLIEIAFNDEAKQVEIAARWSTTPSGRKLRRGLYRLLPGRTLPQALAGPGSAGADALHGGAAGGLAGRSSLPAGSDLCGDQGRRLDRAAQVQDRARRVIAGAGVCQNRRTACQGRQGPHQTDP